MKYALIGILLLYSLSGICFETNEEIDSLTIDDVLFTLLGRAYPVHCTWDIQEGMPVEYQYLINKGGEAECAATIQTLEGELATYKVEETTALNYRIELNNLKATAEAKFLIVKDNYHSAAKKAGLPHISNPAAWYRDNCKIVSTHEVVQACIDKLTLVENKIAEVQAEIYAVNQDILDCKGFKQVIKDATLVQAKALSEDQWREQVFQALKCLARGK